MRWSLDQAQYIPSLRGRRRAESSSSSEHPGELTVDPIETLLLLNARIQHRSIRCWPQSIIATREPSAIDTTARCRVVQPILQFRGQLWCGQVWDWTNHGLIGAMEVTGPK